MKKKERWLGDYSSSLYFASTACNYLLILCISNTIPSIMHLIFHAFPNILPFGRLCLPTRPRYWMALVSRDVHRQHPQLVLAPAGTGLTSPKLQQGPQVSHTMSRARAMRGGGSAPGGGSGPLRWGRAGAARGPGVSGGTLIASVHSLSVVAVLLSSFLLLLC